jgi:ketosteroid isomerase-like protein
MVSRRDGTAVQPRCCAACTKAFNADDYEASLELMAPDVEYHELPGMPGARGMVGTYRGREEVARWLGEFLNEWESFRSSSEGTELGNGRVVVVENGRSRQKRGGCGDDGGRAAHGPQGPIAWSRDFRTAEEALAAARSKA